MDNKIVFKVFSTEPITGVHLRLTPKTREYINQIKRDTGLPASKIVERCLEYAVDNYEVVEV